MHYGLSGQQGETRHSMLNGLQRPRSGSPRDFFERAYPGMRARNASLDRLYLT
jgi:hypothetical protein